MTLRHSHPARRAARWLALGACLLPAFASALTLHVSAAATDTPADAQASAVTAPTQAKGDVGLRAAVAVLAASKSRFAGGHVDRLDIVLGAGTYRLAQPLQLQFDPSWRGTPVTLSGAGASRTILSGAKIVRGFHAPGANDTAAARLPAAARGHVLVAKLADSGIDDAGTFERQGFGIRVTPAPLELFYRGEPQTLARWPNQGFATIASLPDGEKGTRFTVAGAPLDALKAEPELRAMGYWARDWADTTLPVEAVDPSSSTVTLAAPAPTFGMKTGQRMRFENALSQLDQPGEWYLDRASMTLYFWPPAPLHDGDVEASVSNQLLVATIASNLTIHDLGFEDTRGNAIEIHSGLNVVIEHATVRNAGSVAVWSTASNSHYRFMNVSNTGEGGFVVFAGNRQTLAAGDVSIEDSVIHDYALRSRAYRPAISLSGVGDRIERNHIYNGPHAAIIFNGNDHVISGNEVDHVAREAGDTGALYTGRDWTARGTMIEGNFLHDIGSAAQPQATMGIYLDDQAGGTTIRRNVFSKVNQAIFIGGGRDNVVEDNLFVNCTPAIYIDSRGLSWQKGLADDPNGQLRRQLAVVNFNRPPYSTRYPSLASVLADAPGAPKGNVLRRNAVIGGKATSIDLRAASYVDIGPMFGASDVSFVNAKPDAQRSTFADFQIAPSSRALHEGFQLSPFHPIDASGAGKPPAAANE
ncbi:right-handed parallel beta-helix repeat-containing protein [Paraburkholderia rhizosphaerae]|uniref:Parallel beta-helix repeat protein n=1 Tax=Paraburkholderia rhizosphaerae TaxID=480658 RepID=A0A4R8LDZ7_9BURK|nr:right-handed parallel beta-helix repeat-containing protein [Paraburkholderia rhizosphaerae]TDY40508.1 parallel beta-helix repeat protein [Paraburkholderia rhizosphaerae]